MLSRITIEIPYDVREAATRDAHAELRHLRDHVVYILRRDLLERGLLPIEAQLAKTHNAKDAPNELVAISEGETR